MWRDMGQGPWVLVMVAGEPVDVCVRVCVDAKICRMPIPLTLRILAQLSQSIYNFGMC